MRRGILALIGLGSVLGAGAPAGAQPGNLLVDGSFPTPLTTWILRSGEAALRTDRLGRPGSNSLFLHRSSTGTAFMVQYVPVSAGVEYQLGGCLRIDSLENAGESGIAQLGVNPMTAPCNGGGTYLPGEFGTPPIAQTMDAWTCVDPVSFVAPESTECLEFVLFVRNDTGTGMFGVFFDDVHLVPEPGAGAGAALAALVASVRRRAGGGLG